MVSSLNSFRNDVVGMVASFGAYSKLAVDFSYNLNTPVPGG
jgi:hypothetical protein